MPTSHAVDVSGDDFVRLEPPANPWIFTLAAPSPTIRDRYLRQYKPDASAEVDVDFHKSMPWRGRRSFEFLREPFLEFFGQVRHLFSSNSMT